jgi:hypothetical protein
MLATLMVGFGIGIPVYRWASTPAIDGGPARPLSYQILYSTVGSATAQGKAGFELLTVQRPYDATDLTYSRRPGPGAQPTGGAAFTRDKLFAYAGGALQPVSGRQPGPPGYDQDLQTLIPALEARGLAQPLGSDRVIAGRQCQMYRFSEPPSGPITKLSSTEHDDLCLDSQGLILSEVWTLKGKVVQSRLARSVTVGPVAAPLRPRSTSLPAGALGQAQPDPKAASFLPTPVTPSGFTAAVPESFVEQSQQQQGALAEAEVVWAFAKGPNVITVEAGQNAPGQVPWNNTNTVTEPATLTHLGSARSALRSDGVELQVNLGDGQWVRIRGTVPLASLLRYADMVAAPQ